jgi:peptide chain release factor 1
MQDRLRTLLDESADRLAEIGLLLAQPETLADGVRLRELSREHARLEELVADWREFKRLEAELAQSREMAAKESGELAELAASECHAIQEELARREEGLALALVPADPRDGCSLYLEIRAGTGGDEAALFAGDLYRMYSRHGERRGWRIEVLSQSAGEQGGFKEIILRVEGADAWACLKFESGTHRVQRVPATEAQGRIHTSACTVAVLPEADAVESRPIDPSELRIDTFRASGAGGQHVNKTDSAVRLTHLPTGIVVECQDERSQHKNRARALALLQARLLDEEQSRQDRERSQERRLQVGSGDRSQRIRTYNFPQGRLTDHRINLTLYQLGDILEGSLEMVTGALQQEDRTRALAALLGNN